MSHEPMPGASGTEAGPKKRSLLPLFVLLAATLVWFAPPLFFGKTLLSFDERFVPPFVRDRDPAADARPQNLITSDLQGWILAHEETAVARLKRGEVPLWDSTELLGRPLHADASYPTFYPPDAIHLVLPVLQAYAWSMAFHVFLASLGMLLLLRRIGLEHGAALVGAIAFGFSGWMLVHLHIPHFVRSAAWLPWLVLASIRLAAAPGAGRAAWLALAVGMAALAAYPTILGVMLFALAATAVAVSLKAQWKGRSLAWHVVAVVLGLALGGVELVSIAELRSQSLRAGNVSDEVARQKSLRPAHLVSLASPNFQGNPVALRAAEFPVVESYPIARELFSADVQDNYVENNLYGGVAALLLAVAALTAIGTVSRRAAALGFLALFALGLLAAVHSPVQRLLRDLLVPGLGSGSPKRALLLCAFGLAGLAGVGADALLRSSRSSRWLLACAGLALAGTLAVGWKVTLEALELWMDGTVDVRVRGLVAAAFSLPIVLALAASALALSFDLPVLGREIGAVGLVLLLVADLFVFGWRFNPFQPPEARGARTEVVDFLARPEHAGRTARYLERNLLPASIASQWGVQSVDGIQALLVREVAELLSAWQPGSIDPSNPNQVGTFGDPRRFDLPIVDLLARWIVWNQPPPAELGFVQRYASEREGLALSENPDALPAVFFAHRVRVISDREERLAALLAPDFAPARVAIAESFVDVTDLPRSVLADASSAPAAPPPSTAVAFFRRDPETLTVKVETPVAGILVVNEAFFPGWQVEQSGSIRAAIRVDHAFLGFPLSAGSHDLVIRYAPVSFKLGAALSIGALVTIVALALFGLRGARKEGLARGTG